jgi:phosphoesterase RecJ-like protein
MSYTVNVRKTIDTTPARRAVFDEMAAVIDRAERILVVTHLDPDGDAIGTQIAVGDYLRDLGKQVYLVRESTIPTKYRFLEGTDDIVAVESLPDDFSVDTAVILECPHATRVGRAARYLTPDVSTINIDHHADSEPLGKVNWIGYDLCPSTAEALYTAILTDTGRFRFSSTAPRTFQVAAELVRAGADPRKVCDAVYFNFPLSTLKLAGKVVNSVEFHHDGTICVLTMERRMLSDAGAHESESDGIVDNTLVCKGVVVGALFKEIDDGITKVSLRSRDRIDVAAVAGEFGGGGHRNAAGCTIDKPLAETRRIVIEKLGEAVERGE